MTPIDYDLEFLENGKTIELISIGLAADDGRTYYAVNSDAPWDRVQQHRWLMANVWPHLPLFGYKPAPQINALQVSTGHVSYKDTQVKPHWVIANEVRDFILSVPQPQLWADYGAYDHVTLTQLWGTMAQLPAGIPMWTHDLRQEIERLGLTDDELPAQVNRQHHALDDALHQQALRRWLAEEQRGGTQWATCA